MEQFAKEEEELELSLPSNYVTIAHLQQRWLQKKQPLRPPPLQEKEVPHRSPPPQPENEAADDFQSKHATIVQLRQPCLLQQKHKKKRNKKKKTRREDAQQDHPPRSNLGKKDDEESKSNNCNKEEAAFGLWNLISGKNDQKIIEPPEPHDSFQPQIEQTAAAAVIVNVNLNIEEEEEENRTDFSRISKKETPGRKPNVNKNLNGGILQLLQPEIEDDKTKLRKRNGKSHLRRRNHAVWEPKGSSKSNMAPLAENLEDLSLNAATATAAAAEIETNIPNASVGKKNMRMNKGVSDRFPDKPKPRANPNPNWRQRQNNGNNLVWVKKGGDSMDEH